LQDSYFVLDDQGDIIFDNLTIIGKINVLNACEFEQFSDFLIHETENSLINLVLQV
jgi:hypothetical protein